MELMTLVAIWLIFLGLTLASVVFLFHEMGYYHEKREHFAQILTSCFLIITFIGMCVVIACGFGIMCSPVICDCENESLTNEWKLDSVKLSDDGKTIFGEYNFNNSYKILNIPSNICEITKDSDEIILKEYQKSKETHHEFWFVTAFHKTSICKTFTLSVPENIRFI